MDILSIEQQIRALDVMNEIPYIEFSQMSLGGHTSYFVHASLNKKEEWLNGIFHNSKYAIFSITDGKIELIAKHYEMPKFRKCKSKDESNVANKIVSYFVNV